MVDRQRQVGDRIENAVGIASMPPESALLQTESIADAIGRTTTGLVSLAFDVAAIDSQPGGDSQSDAVSLYPIALVRQRIGQLSERWPSATSIA